MRITSETQLNPSDVLKTCLCWRTLWVGLPACGAALWGLLSVADLWGPGRPSHLGVGFLTDLSVVGVTDVFPGISGFTSTAMAYHVGRAGMHPL